VTPIYRLIALLMLTLALPTATASASSTQEVSLQDNRLLLQSSPTAVANTLSTLRQLGVQRVRVSVVWWMLAPNANSRQAPKHFNASDPGAYSAAAWRPFDTLVELAPRFGLGVNFDVTGNAPLWGVRNTSNRNLRYVWYPNPTAFGQFVKAVGRRYSGSYRPKGSHAPIPKVNYWSIWNEPNVGGSSLSPQTVNGIEVGPSIYRGLLDSAWSALRGTGHGHDTVLVGELASTGHQDPGASLGMQPMRFLRALFCVGSDSQPLRGRAATARGCPASGNRGRFRGQHPALFNATGWSHHPYNVYAPPDAQPPSYDGDWADLIVLSRLENGLDRAEAAYGQHRRLPIYLTEYGYNTNPPQTTNAFSPSLQAAYLNEAEYMASQDPRVKAWNQYLLEDSPVRPGSQYSAFASGLVYGDGKHKPSFDAFRLPLWLPKTAASRGQTLQLWGCLRPAAVTVPEDGSQTVDIQFQAGGSGVYQTVKPVTISRGSSCYFTVNFAFAESGNVRLAYTYPAGDPLLPAGKMFVSRSVAVTIS
jgi:hypothetical protein